MARRSKTAAATVVGAFLAQEPRPRARPILLAAESGSLLVGGVFRLTANNIAAALLLVWMPMLARVMD